MFSGVDIGYAPLYPADGGVLVASPCGNNSPLCHSDVLADSRLLAPCASGVGQLYTSSQTNARLRYVIRFLI